MSAKLAGSRDYDSYVLYIWHSNILVRDVMNKIKFDKCGEQNFFIARSHCKKKVASLLVCLIE